MAGYMRIQDYTFETNKFADTWLKLGRGFSYVKMAHEIIKQYAATGTVNFSNDYFIRDTYSEKGIVKRGAAINRTERTIQWGFTVLESIGLIKRQYKNESKTKRSGIDVNEETLLRILSMKKKDVELLSRDNPIKHLRNQMPATIKPSKAKSLLKRISREKNEQKRHALKIEVDKINEMYREYDLQIKEIIAKNQKYIESKEIAPDVKQSDERIAAVKQYFSSFVGIDTSPELVF
ncbi:MAG: hypothetical protein RBQ91_00415 [Acholeplasma sp.]|nr:hypothetical protein [Acholeplasma sp.]